jgi:hypothetical protein
MIPVNRVGEAFVLPAVAAFASGISRGPNESILPLAFSMTQMRIRQDFMTIAVRESNGSTLTKISRMRQEGHHQARMVDCADAGMEITAQCHG